MGEFDLSLNLTLVNLNSPLAITRRKGYKDINICFTLVYPMMISFASFIRIVLLCSAAALVLSGCMGRQLAGVPDVYESPEVQTAPWPRLADAPAVVPVDPEEEGNVAAQANKGTIIETELAAHAAALEALERQMRSRPVFAGDLSAEAARLRRSVQNMQNANP